MYADRFAGNSCAYKPNQLQASANDHFVIATVALVALAPLFNYKLIAFLSRKRASTALTSFAEQQQATKATDD